MHVAAGQLIGAKYELERMLGKGSMGEVWLARHTSLEGLYAVKLIDVRTVPDAAARFQMEAFIAAKLSKKTRHIVSVTDHGTQNELAYLVMELLEGESLEDRIVKQAPLPPRDVAGIIAQVARALSHAQAEGFVHRDLKPANIFITHDEDGRMVVKLLDFGIARVIAATRGKSPFATAKDTLIGTPTYMSPEQARGLDTLDHRADLWALAVVSYEALTREVPFEGETIQDTLISIGIGRQTPIRVRRPDLPVALDAFYAKAFAGDIDERFAQSLDLATAFAKAVGASDIDASSAAPAPSALRAPNLRARRRSMPPSLSNATIMKPGPPTSRRVLSLALAAAALLLAGVAVASLLGDHSPPTLATPRTADPERTTSSSISATTKTSDPLTPSPSSSPAPPPSSSVSPSLSLSLSVSPSASPSASASASPSPSPSASPVRSATPTPSRSPAPSASRTIDRGEIF